MLLPSTQFVWDLRATFINITEIPSSQLLLQWLKRNAKLTPKKMFDEDWTDQFCLILPEHDNTKPTCRNLILENRK